MVNEDFCCITVLFVMQQYNCRKSKLFCSNNIILKPTFGCFALRGSSLDRLRLRQGEAQ